MHYTSVPFRILSIVTCYPRTCTHYLIKNPSIILSIVLVYLRISAATANLSARSQPLCCIQALAFWTPLELQYCNPTWTNHKSFSSSYLSCHPSLNCCLYSTLCDVCKFTSSYQGYTIEKSYLRSNQTPYLSFSIGGAYPLCNCRRKFEIYWPIGKFTPNSKTIVHTNLIVIEDCYIQTLETN